MTDVSQYCDAKFNDNYRITHKAVPKGRILVCAKCSATFDWWMHQDYLPVHVANKTVHTKDEIIASWENGEAYLKREHG